MAAYLKGGEYDALWIFDRVNCQHFDQEISPGEYGGF